MKTISKYLNYGLMAEAMMREMYIITNVSSPIFIPRKHTKMKYADHKRAKQKRINKSK